MGKARLAVLVLAAVVAGALVVGLMRAGDGDAPALTTADALVVLERGKPDGYPQRWWDSMLGGVRLVLEQQRVQFLTAHHVQMILNTLTHFASSPLPSDEEVAYYTEHVKWSLPRFLSHPPTPQETARVLEQIDDLASFMASAAGGAAGPAGLSGPAEEDLSQWRDHSRTIAQSFVLATSLHPVPEADLAAAKDAFSGALREPGRERLPKGLDGPFQQMAAISLARSALWNAYITASASPPPETPPGHVADRLPSLHEADGRLMQARAEANLQRFRANALAEDLRGEREDLEAWALMLDGAEVQRMVAGGKEWACRFEVGIGTRAAVSVWAARTDTGSVVLRLPRVAGPSPSKWRWENRDVEVDAERLYVRQAPVGAQTWLPLDAPPPTELVHFTDQDWGKALAAQALASRNFWQALTPYVQGESHKTGATDLASGIGLMPFLAIPTAQRVDRPKAGEAVRLLSAEGQDVGTVRCEYGFREAALEGTPSVITLELGARTVTGGVTMRVKHGGDQAPTEQRWSAPIPAEVRKVVFRLTASAPASPALDSIVASDEKGETLCSLGVSDLRFD